MYKLPFNQPNSKSTRLAGKIVFFHSLKAKQEKQKKQNKKITKNKTNIET